MTLQKAVEILIDLLGEGPQFSPDDRREAVSLGIEALKWYQGQKERRSQPIWLLGETES